MAVLLFFAWRSGAVANSLSVDRRKHAARIPPNSVQQFASVSMVGLTTWRGGQEVDRVAM